MTALDRVKHAKAHEYASDQYGVDTTIDDDILQRIIDIAVADEREAVDRLVLAAANIPANVSCPGFAPPGLLLPVPNAKALHDVVDEVLAAR